MRTTVVNDSVEITTDLFPGSNEFTFEFYSSNGAMYVCLDNKKEISLASLVDFINNNGISL